MATIGYIGSSKKIYVYYTLQTQTPRFTYIIQEKDTTWHLYLRVNKLRARLSTLGGAFASAKVLGLAQEKQLLRVVNSDLDIVRILRVLEEYGMNIL